MTEPVRRAIRVDLLREIIQAGTEVAEDLEAEIDARWHARAEQPVHARKHERDMATVRRLREALVALQLE